MEVPEEGRIGSLEALSVATSLCYTSVDNLSLCIVQHDFERASFSNQRVNQNNSLYLA